MLLSRTAIPMFMIVIAITVSGVARGQTETEQVEQYLMSLELDELALEFLEMEAARETDLAARRKLVTKLVNEYASQMMSGRDVGKTNLQEKTKLLLATYPELATIGIRIATLQAEYLRLEKVFREWWDSDRNRAQRTELVDRMRDLADELDQLNRSLNSQYEDQVATLQTASANKQNISARLRQLEGQLLHTEFLIGWTSYFRGILESGERSELMAKSDAHFRSFLQIEPDRSITEIAPEWFDLSSDWNSRALVGLGMCQRGLNHPEQSQYCFELVGSHSTNPFTRDLRYVWELSSRVYLNEVSAAQQFVESMGEARHISDAGRVAFWAATLKSSMGLRADSPLVSQRLLRAGLAGLTREFQANQLQAFILENNIELADQDFLSLWVDGYLSFHAGEEKADSSKFEAAKSKLLSALKLANDAASEPDVARCEYLIARIDLRNRDYESAANAFLNCSRKLDFAAPELAAECQWQAVRSLSELSRENPRYLLKANRAADELIKRFPGSTFSSRAEFEKLRINVVNLPVEKALERLRRFGPNDSNFALAQNEIVKLRYQQWLDLFQSKSDQSGKAFADLVEAESEYKRISGTTTESKLKTQFLVIDAMLRDESTKFVELDNKLNQTEALVNEPNVDSAIYQEFRYFKFLLANRNQDQESATKEALWISENAQGTRFEKSALIQLAQLSDQQLRAEPAPSKQQREQTTAVFERLVRMLGNSASDIKNSPNARVAILRLAELKIELGAFEECSELLKPVLKALPNHKSTLRLVAIAYTQSNRHVDAMPVWQKLVRGVDPGSDLWFESKYNLAVCLSKSGDEAQARQLLDQTVRLSPTIPDNWATLIRTLLDSLNSNVQSPTIR